MKTTALISLLLLACVTSQADTILGVYASVSHWQHDMTDDFPRNQDGHRSEETGNVFYVALEHPLPFLPNVKLQRNDIDSKVSGLFDVTDFFGPPFFRRTITNQADLSHTDLMLYYEVLDKWLNLDLGLSLKQFDGFSVFESDNFQTGRIDLDVLVPMLFGKGQVDLPFTGLSAHGTVEALSPGDVEVTDIELGLNYESKIGLGGALGYRSLNTDWRRSNGLRADYQLDGFFVGLNYHF